MFWASSSFFYNRLLTYPYWPHDFTLQTQTATESTKAKVGPFLKIWKIRHLHYKIALHMLYEYTHSLLTNSFVWILWVEPGVYLDTDYKYTRMPPPHRGVSSWCNG